jgi:hypothetical protein
MRLSLKSSGGYCFTAGSASVGVAIGGFLDMVRRVLASNTALGNAPLEGAVERNTPSATSLPLRPFRHAMNARLA